MNNRRAIMHKQIVGVVYAAIVFFGVVSTAQAAPVLIPAGLIPGDMYQLAFVTSTTRDAQSRDIAAYNQHVQNAADNAGIGSGSTLFGFDVTWTAIASTPSVDARDNARVEGEVYNLGGLKVADSFEDMWDGILDATIIQNEKGETHKANVWTGSHSNGVRFLPLGASKTTYGSNDDLNFIQWIEIESIRSDVNQNLYGLSQKLTVPAPVPAPTTTILFGTGLVALVAWRTRRQTADS